MREMSANTRDLVVRALKRVETGQMKEEEAGAWMAEKVKDIKLLTDGVLNELWDKCTFVDVHARSPLHSQAIGVT